MGKEMLLSKAHLRKNRATSIGLFLLMLIGSLLINLSLLLMLDAYPTATKEAKRLNAGDGYIRISNDTEGMDDAFFKKILAEDTEDFEATKSLCYTAVSLPFGNGDVCMNLLVSDKDALTRRLGRAEIITEDQSIKAPYLYLPYQFYTSGGFEIGDAYQLELTGKKYEFTVRGFINDTYYGCNNTGTYEVIPDELSFNELSERDSAVTQSISIVYILREGVKNSAFAIQVNNEILKTNPGAVINSLPLETVMANKSFMSLIIAVSFLAVSFIVMLVILLMLVNCITNYIRENMKAIGALKAVGYLSRNIKLSLVMMFAGLCLVGSLLGIVISYLLMPATSVFVVGQMGVPYTVSFTPVATLCAFLGMMLYTILVSLFSLGKIRKIEPIIALREGVESHNFKKNRVRLDAARFSLNTSLALKTMFLNMKQNMITFIVSGVMIFICVIGLLMYENFNRKPSLGLMSFEICGGVIGFDDESKEDAKEFLEEMSEVSNVKNIINLYFYYRDEDRLQAYVMDDVTKMNNKDVCYKGRFPMYDNEIIISGKFADEYALDIGDEIRLDYGDESYSYLITGLMQTTNNDGREAVVTWKAAEHLVDLEHAPAYYYFDSENKEESEKVLDKCTDEFGSHVLSTLNFYEVVEGSMTTFKSIATLMLIVVCTISGIVMLLVLYLLIKSLIYSKRKDFGVYKALGYTTRNLMYQTALSFMPSIILSVAVFSVVSYKLANPYMGLIMRSFGLMKCTFTIPVGGVILIAAGFVLLAFVFALFESRRIKKIDPVRLLTAE